jgi:membrane fusion protein, multidrug efflux system
MSFDPEGRDLGDQALRDRRGRASASATAAVDEPRTEDSEVNPARARAPMSEQNSEQRPLVESSPLNDDQYPDQDGPGEDKPTGFLRRHRFAVALGMVLFLPITRGGYLYWDYSRQFESTDDAFIAARSFSIAPKVSGYLTAVPVTDNQHVALGDVIARIDDRDYRVALEQAQAQVENAQANIQNTDAQISEQEAQINATQASVFKNGRAKV